MTMMENMMGGMWIAGLIGLLLVIVLLLAAAALVKYLLGSKRSEDKPHD
jgi:predicted PurR-regulated permease PerM